MNTTQGRQPLADPGPLGDGHGEAFFGCVVVGSGFGGAVMAARLAPHLPAGRLAVLERGREFRPGDFPRTGRAAINEVRSPRRPLGLFELGFAADIDYIVGNGLGGGSLIYANVTLEPLPGVLAATGDPSDPCSPRRWPAAISHATLAPYYARVRRMLAVEKYVDADDVRRGETGHDPALAGSFFHGAEAGTDPATGQALTDYRERPFAQRPALRRTAALRDFAGDAGAESAFRKVPIAVNLTRHRAGQLNEHGTPQAKCTLCGNCVTGCNVGAKNDLTTNYLPVARASGARLFTQVEVSHITPSSRPGYRYCVHAVSRDQRDGRLVEHAVRVHTNILVISAGAFGTPRILLASARRGPLRFSAALGGGFSGNADTFVLSYAGRSRMDAVGRDEPTDMREQQPGRTPDTEAGPTITAMTDLRRVPGAGLLVQDGAIPAVLAAGLRRMLTLRTFAARMLADDIPAEDGHAGGPAPSPGAARDRRRHRPDPLDGAVAWLAMGHDNGRGQLRLDRRERVRVHWPEAAAQPALAAADAAFARLAAAAGGLLLHNPRLSGRQGGTPVTVHPLGGCRMADTVEAGTVDDTGRVYRPDGTVHRGLYIADASVCDGSLGANPSLTIAALAERAAERIAAEDLPLLLAAMPGR